MLARPPALPSRTCCHAAAEADGLPRCAKCEQGKGLRDHSSAGRSAALHPAPPSFAAPLAVRAASQVHQQGYSQHLQARRCRGQACAAAPAEVAAAAVMPAPPLPALQQPGVHQEQVPTGPLNTACMHPAKSTMNLFSARSSFYLFSADLIRWKSCMLRDGRC